MFSSNKVSIERSLYEQSTQRAKSLGYPSLDEWVMHLLERELKAHDEPVSREKMIEKMKGLGYMQ